jgi:hypothetical protein
VAILQALNDFQYLRSTWLFALCGEGSVRGFKNRLTYLFHDAGLIERPIQQGQCLHARYMPAVYRLSEAGRQWLSDHGCAVHRGCHSEGPFAHNLLAAEILADIKRAVDRTDGLRFIFSHEILKRAPEGTRVQARPFAIPVTIAHTFPSGRAATEETKYIADAWFGIEYRKADGGSAYRFFCVEVNHHTEMRATKLSAATHLRKFLSLRALRAAGAFRTHLGLSAPVMSLFVQTRPSATAASMALLRTLSGGGNPFVAFKTMPTFQQEPRAPIPEGRAFSEPWLRVGHPDFFIGS